MKALAFPIIILAGSFCVRPVNAQTVNWNSLNQSTHIVFAGVGWDYSVSYTAAYARRINSKMPILLDGNLSIPSGQKLLDDFKISIGGQAVLLNKTNIKGGISIHGIYRRYENPLVTLQNLGGEVKGTVGYYKTRWFVAGEVAFDKAIATHFKHSQSFRKNVYNDVKDGWSESSTGGNFLYGLQTDYSFKKSDVTFKIGKVVTQDFRTTPLVPYYLMLGYNYRID